MPTKLDLEELSEKIHRFQIYDYLLGLFVLILIGLILFTYYLGTLVGSFISVDMSRVGGIFSLTPGFLLSILVHGLLKKKRDEYYVESDEWTVYFILLISQNLNSYLSTPSSGMKKRYRKDALKFAKDFLSCIEERWTIGNIRPVKQYVGDSISNLKKNLRYRIIPGIKDGDEEILKKVANVMFSFENYLTVFSIESINNINKQISEELPNREPLKIGYLMRFSMFLKSHNYIRHSFATSIIVTVCVLFAYTLLTYSNVAKEYILASSVALFGILLGTYFSRQPREEK